MTIKYWKGEKVQLTGKTEYLYGGLFDEAIILTGQQKGKTIHIKSNKKGQNNEKV